MSKLSNKLSLFSNKKGLYVVSLGFVFGFVTVSVAYLAFLENRIAPNTYINGRNVGLLTKSAALEVIENKVPEEIKLFHEGDNYELNLSDIDFEYDYVGTIDKAYNVGRSGKLTDHVWSKFESLYKPNYIDYSINLDENLLAEYLSVISGNIVEEPVLPSVTKTEKGILINPGQAGRTVDSEYLMNVVTNQLVKNSFVPISIVTINTPTLSEQELSALQNKADQLLGKSITAVYEDDSIVFGDVELVESLLPQNKVETLVQKTKSQVDRQPQNAVFTFVDSIDSGKKVVKEFKPAKNGLEVDAVSFQKELVNGINLLSTSDNKELHINIPVQTSKPEITTESVNNHGIRELIGQGSSKFVGSIPSRIHNVGVASAKFNGVLVAPNDVFSFNEIVGDISVLTGYQQAYIIKDGATVLGDGGGVCQVSTTLFRAALDAGLPIVERRSHSYRVSYYEQDAGPGLDATVYSPTTDLKIKNDTPAHILIQTYYDPNQKTLEFELYGTSDGRVATVTKPVITSSTPPPEDLYIDDPNMKVGQIKQIDWKAWGAKTSFNYTVERNGEVIYEKTFYSNYQPWQAKYLRGTAAI